MLVVGEVHTGLLRGRDPMSAREAASLVDLVAGEPVLRLERPRSYVRSPERPVGVDCPLGAPAPARQVRGIGTVLQRAAITGGHIVQGTAWTTLTRATGSARQPWSHYLARLGVIEAVGRVQPTELTEAFAAPDRAAGALDLGGIAALASDLVQSAVPAGGRSRERLRLPRTRLRFVVEQGDTAGPPSFAVHDDQLRIMRVTLPAEAPPRLLVAFGEDLALHDWLLTSVIGIVDRAAIGALPRDESLGRLRPAVDYLLHLWLPAGRGGELAGQLWETLERRAAFTRQWALLRDRIRDQFAVGAVAALSAAMPR
ncbi:SCO2521 family protein [Actinoplanes derwentensis]|uniref:SCO2521 family protein n=1 Tax=Actinoplanes derwentensis TaxID=113562 RepID=UPI000B864440|nr:SCO2521 family protein [Actinoplanes derwentensis]